MRKKHGFTLVELLVVMAIISILAAIAIPNVQKWILKGKATRAISEISNIELALTKLLSDASRSSLKDIINQSEVENIVGDTMDNWTPAMFDAAVIEYTNATYAILRKGRAVLDPDGDGITDPLYNAEVVRNLGTSYMTELARDPWGNLYNIYPGPWRASDGPVPFRTYLPPDTNDLLPGDTVASARDDELSLGVNTNGDDNFPAGLVDPETNEPLPLIGAPAPRETDVFIWSDGVNLISGQAKFNSAGYLYADGINNYEGGQEPELMGGGDDINNWDRERTYMRFYN
jgi:prepilin-type N-terminal cleavage/methylation domain-containing protein